MRAVGYYQSLAIDTPQSLLDLDLPIPHPGPRDLRVRVKAISVNPVDVKVRAKTDPDKGQAKILGWDAAGIVDSVGADVTLFKPGDEVFYAGSIARQGTDSELHLVDERIVGRKPKSLSFTEAAALPLTAITAWELLFDRLAVTQDKTPQPAALLVVGGAGGVGSILIQLARQLTGLTVIATASRPETKQWCLDLGAHHVIDHTQPLGPQIKGLPAITHIASLTGTEQHFPALADIIAPQGRIGIIDDPKNLDSTLLKHKSVSLNWEFMFTRALYETPDMIAQHHLLNEVSSLVDRKILRTTLGENLGAVTAANLKRAHTILESGRAKGKLVLEF